MRGVRTDIAIGNKITENALKIYNNINRIERMLKQAKKTLPNPLKRIDKRILKNLDKLAGAEIEAVINGGAYNEKLSYQALIEIQEKGLYPNGTPRPFLEPFKKKLRVKMPDSLKRPSASFSTIKKDIEDYVWEQFIETMQKNKLGLPKPKYRDGTPLYRSGRMVSGIDFKVVEK